MKRSLLLIVMFVCAAFSAGAAGRESVKTVHSHPIGKEKVER